ncbi:hypothetical protein [Sulfoacidibacillus ferrooxidans]|uniref:Uncharacterized protein n=1 Tax=Sulfoacidibacillus ferrooxidans TaxID=2005001 RepID=A0A9X1VB96_9BACL|nr:hypothetical protein [Sulfoacidibacillus ferrooxidans]MCI0184517.1 hypothetical protein [Sulfoacidibacillus ferrooxidans]
MHVRSLEMKRKNGTTYRLETDLTDEAIRKQYPKDSLVSEHALRGKSFTSEEDDV